MLVKKLRTVCANKPFKCSNSAMATSTQLRSNDFLGDASNTMICPAFKSKLKAFDQIPGPKGLPFLGTFFEYIRPGGLKFTKMFEVMDMRSKQYGPIYKEKIGSFTSVVISDLEEYTKVMKVDGKYPDRIELGPIWHYRKSKGMDLGLVNSQGHDWQEKRQILSPKLLKPMEMLSHVSSVDDITSDFVDLLRTNFGSQPPVFRSNGTHSDGSFVCLDLENNLFYWALESVCSILFGSRIGCMSRPAPDMAKSFVNNLLGMFKTMQTLMYGVPFYQLYPTRTWKKFENYYTGLIRAGEQLMAEKHKEIKNSQSSSSPSTSSSENLLNYLLSQSSLTPTVANLTCIDVMNGAVETTSNGILWTLYCLGKNKSAQDALFKECAEFLPNLDSKITPEIFSNLRYVRACIKEALRLFPITFATSRRIASDIEACGYAIPSGTHCQANIYTMGQDRKLFPDPETYRPERWLRSGQLTPLVNVLSTLPFGHGARMCIGRRLAEMEMYILLIRMIRSFEVEYVEREPVSPVLHTVMIPDRPLKLKMTPRK